MYSAGQLAVKYLGYYARAHNGRGHGMHSPFVYDFITSVLNDRDHYPDYDRVEELRRNLLADHRSLNIEDMGAGSTTRASSVRSVRSIAKSASKGKKFGQLLYRIARHYHPKNILELGTSLGITTSYLSLGNPAANVVTMEGASSVADLAKSNLDTLGIGNATIVRGNFDDQLGKVVGDHQSIDLVFLDGNHRQEPTERYVLNMLPVMGNASILIMDDIHWSREMEKAWANVQAHPRVTCTIDLFFVGIVLFRAEFHAKQHFAIRF